MYTETQVLIYIRYVLFDVETGRLASVILAIISAEVRQLRLVFNCQLANLPK